MADDKRPAVRPTEAQAEPDLSKTFAVGERAQTKKGKDPEKLAPAELLKAAVSGELSTTVAPVITARNPGEAFDALDEAQNGLPYANVDEQFKVNPS